MVGRLFEAVVGLLQILANSSSLLKAASQLKQPLWLILCCSPLEILDSQCIVAGYSEAA